MLVTLSEMKSYLGISPLVTDYDSFLTQQLQIVSDAVEMYCSRKFESANYIQTFYKSEFPYDYDFNSLQLAVFPTIAITSIVEKEDEDDLVGTAVTAYRVHKPTSIIQKNQGAKFLLVNTILEVQYSAGYATIPTLIKSVVYSIVQERYNKKLNGIDLNFGSDIQRISIPGTIGIDFDYSLENNQRKTHLGSILGNHVNVLDAFRSEQSVIGSVRLNYVS